MECAKGTGYEMFEKTQFSMMTSDVMNSFVGHQPGRHKAVLFGIEVQTQFDSTFTLLIGIVTRVRAANSASVAVRRRRGARGCRCSVIPHAP